MNGYKVVDRQRKKIAYGHTKGLIMTITYLKDLDTMFLIFVFMNVA